MGYAPDWLRQNMKKAGSSGPTTQPSRKDMGSLFHGAQVQRLADGGPVRSFDAESEDYDYETARRYGMGPTGDGSKENEGHWGTRVELNDKDRPGDLPPGTGVMLKGRGHPTWDKGVQGEEDAGYSVVKHRDRYYSVPKGGAGK
jgi:hypothetical protein